MKTGTVVYVGGMAGAPAGFDLDEAIARAGLNPDTTVAVASGPREPSPQFAELILKRRGAHRVVLASGVFDAEKGFELLHRGS